MTLDNSNVNSTDSIFNDVYIYGRLYYDFDLDDVTFRNVEIKENLLVGGISTFVGIATFKDDVFIDGRLDLDFLTVSTDFNVGVGGTLFTADTRTEKIGIGTTTPLQNVQVGVDTGTFVIDEYGIIGIGTTSPGIGIYYDDDNGINQRNDTTQGPLKLDAEGSVAIRRNIYDSAGAPGINGMFLKRNEFGIRWTTVTPNEDQQGILIQDEGVEIPLTGVAQTFHTINFVQRNSFGQGTDTLVPTAQDPTVGTGLATIFTNDLWGHNGTGQSASIYRQSKVGIKNLNPSTDLDITGTLHATQAVDFDSTLNVDGVATFTDNTSSTNPTSGAVQISGGVGINEKLNVQGNVTFESQLQVKGNTDLDGQLDVQEKTNLQKDLDVGGISKFLNITDTTDLTSGAIQVTGGVSIQKKLNVGKEVKLFDTLNVVKPTTLNDTLTVGKEAFFDDTTPATSSTSNASVQIDGGVAIAKNLYIGEEFVIEDQTQSINKDTGALIVDGGVGIEKNINVGGAATITEDLRVDGETQSDDTTTGALVVDGGVGIGKSLNVGENTKIIGTLELENSIIDKLNSVGYDINKTKNDYRLSAMGAGVSWRPSGVETDNAIWVTVDGDDNNSGLLEGDAKRTVGGAAAVAKGGDTIIIRSGTYVENNPIGLRTDVSVSGEDLRLVTIVPQNRTKDVFHVRRGCLIQNLNFSGPTDDGQGGVSYAHTDCGAVAFPPTQAAVNAGEDSQAVSGFTDFGPANEGPSGRWRSPYVRNCTNFMTKSIGMKINGNYADANFTGVTNLGQDLKSMVCDSFTQYNENGIGVLLSNNAYAQLVSIFTIATDVGISCITGGQCDLTNSNSSFGNVGLKADGIGATEFTGNVFENTAAENDTFPIDDCKDVAGSFRKPFDGQGLFFKINLADYADTTATGVLTQPMQLIRSIKIIDGGLPGDYNPAAPPIISVPLPLGPEAIQPEFSANVSAAGTITSVDVISSGRNFLANQSFTVNVTGGGNAQLEVDTDPILFTINSATEPTITGLTTVTFNEFVPYKVNAGVDIELRRISRIITSSHSFEYIGAGTDINKANPFQGGVPIPENEVIAINGGQVPFTSTDQKGNFRIGEGLIVDQTTSTISGRDFNRAIQAQLTPLILALR